MKKPNVEDQGWCGFQEHVFVRRRGFSFLGFFLVAVGVLWFLQSVGIITVKIPWWPVIVIMLGLWLMVNKFYR